MMLQHEYVFKLVIESENSKIYNKLKKGLDNLVFLDKRGPYYEKDSNQELLSSGEYIGVQFYTLCDNNEASNTQILYQVWLLNPEERFNDMKKYFDQGSLVNLLFDEGSGLENITNTQELKDLILNESNEYLVKKME